MEVYADAPSHRRRYHALRGARLEAQLRARRTTCALCKQRRLCAEVEWGAGFYCLADCWQYQLGVTHGENAAAETVRRLVNRELDRVFSPAAVSMIGWPRVRCDHCEEWAPPFQREPGGWLSLGRDAHLCPWCAEKLRSKRESMDVQSGPDLKPSDERRMLPRQVTAPIQPPSVAAAYEE